MRLQLNKILTDIWYLFYPNDCEICNCNLTKGQRTLCPECISKIPRTNFHLNPESELAQVFWGRVKLEKAAAYMHFIKGSDYQKLIHKLKYKNKPTIGDFLGHEFGSELYKEKFFDDIDLVVPVPLHISRKEYRGYNQAEEIAYGLCAALHKKIDTKNLIRAKATSTQTKKSKYERWQNVANVFKVKKQEAFSYKHILLVDDVITTGSTIEACAQCLKEIRGVKVSILCIGFASD